MGGGGEGCRKSEEILCVRMRLKRYENKDKGLINSRLAEVLGPIKLTLC